MAREMTEKDWELSEKVVEEKDNPNFEATCPYCATKIEYIECGTSYLTKCQTDGCFKFTFRGI